MRAGAGHSAWDVLSRALAGVLGGYVLAQVLSIALAAPWPQHRTDAVLVAMQLSLVIYAVAIMWAFAARTALRAWVGMALACVVSGAAAWVAL